MQLRQILNRVKKQNGFFYRSNRFYDFLESILVEIRPRSGGRPICGDRGPRYPGYDTLTERRIEFVRLRGIVVYFVHAMRRVNCVFCGVIVERLL
jgi:hypothetical protein